MLEFAHLVPRPAGLDVVLDVVGTGGDGSGSVNISTMSALIAAAAGAPVIKHGKRAASSQAGAADVLEAVGVTITLTPESVGRCAADVGIGFCLAPAHHPALRHAAPVRRELGVPSVFNILGPLTNPGLANASLVGCSNERLAPRIAAVLHERGVSAHVVETTLSPTQLGIPAIEPALLRGGEPARNAELLLKVLDPETPQDDPDAAAVDAIRHAVAVNAAAALVAFDAACGNRGSGDLTSRVLARMTSARAALDDGAALAVLRAWIARSAEVA